MPIVLLVIAVSALGFIMIRSGGPLARAVFLRRTGLAFMCAATALMAVFVVGDAFADPGGWRAAVLAASWLAPLAGLSVFAWLRPDWAAPVLATLTAATVALAIWFAVSPQWWQAVENQDGPVRALATFALGLPVALLGWRRPVAGASLLLVLGLAPALVSAAGPGYGEAALVSVSTPPAVAGLLYAAAEVLARRAPAQQPPQQPSARETPPGGPPPGGGSGGQASPRETPGAQRPRPGARWPARLREWFRRPARLRSPAHR